MPELNTIQMGKQGVTKALVGEIDSRLRKHKQVKVKILKSAKVNKKEVADKVADQTGSKVLDIRGNTFILSR